ncbi:unnamed protein product [Pseudo-nitzschia multistriata]|uniref:Cyclin C-terminal domain-containing protein n=1 Tax=Pseudo-nitzschia multistriata TaxID=183589 RepID=A0A448ZGK0_9STRA|nr:unnamed protein product [Pseudo-nitzschia multistriata]
MRAAQFGKLYYSGQPNGPSRMEIEQKAVEHCESLSDSLAVLQKQEIAATYKCKDYLAMTEFRLNIYDLLPNGRMNSDITAQNPQQQSQPQCPVDSQIDEYCREQIVEWSFRVVDYFHIDREVVVFSLSMLDRFLALCKCDRATFKLAATTTLHLAVKILHPCKLAELGILSDLSRGEFDMKDVASMETHILAELQWQLHPPSPIAFCTVLLDLFFSSQKMGMVHTDVNDLYDISSFFTELALCDYYFVGVTPSIVAITSIVNALEGMFGPENKVAPRILKLARETNIYQNQDLSQISHRLWELYERSEECALHNNVDAMEVEKTPETATVPPASAAEVFVRKGDCGAQVVSDTGSPVSVSKHGKTLSSNELMCAMRSQTLRNGSW